MIELVSKKESLAQAQEISWNTSATHTMCSAIFCALAKFNFYPVQIPIFLEERWTYSSWPDRSNVNLYGEAASWRSSYKTTLIVLGRYKRLSLLWLLQTTLLAFSVTNEAKEVAVLLGKTQDTNFSWMAYVLQHFSQRLPTMSGITANRDFFSRLLLQCYAIIVRAFPPGLQILIFNFNFY